MNANGDCTIHIEDDPETGRRLKYYRRAADERYWTELWKRQGVPTYRRELEGHLPHQLRSTFARWVEAPARVLEAGCGLAQFTVALRARGYRAEGLDWSRETVDRLRERFPAVPWHVGDVRKLEFDDGSFDAVYSPGVCEHFEEGPVQILEETRRVLRPGGTAVISTPCFNRWLQARPDLFAGCAEPPGGAGEFYQYAFSPDGMSRLLERLRFTVLDVRPYGSLTTLMRFAGWRVPGPMTTPLAVLMNHAPVLRNWGASCVWVVRRPADG